MYPLIVSRPDIKLQEVKGALDSSMIEPEHRRYVELLGLKPLMKNQRGAIPGVLSGRRSALTIWVPDTGHPHVIKIKGSGDWDHVINTKRETSGEPLGGQTLTYARNDVTATQLINRLFLDEAGVRNAISPLGVMVYDGYRFDGEACAAGVYRAFGDTRIDELVNLLIGTAIERKIVSPRFDRNVKRLLEDLGRYAGSLVNVVYRNGLIWGTRLYEDGDVLSNAHAGNFVLFPDGEKTLRIGMVDFDAESLAEVIRNDPKLRRVADIFKSSYVKDGRIYSLDPRALDVWELIKERRFAEVPPEYMQLLEFSLLGSSFSGFINLADENGRIVTPNGWLESFFRGFARGFETPYFGPVHFDYDRLIEEVTEALTNVSEQDIDFIYRLNKHGKKGGKDYNDIVKTNYSNHMSKYKERDDYILGKGLDRICRFRDDLYNDKHNSENLYSPQFICRAG